MKKLVLLLTYLFIIGSLSYSQSTYLVENQLPAEYCASVTVTVGITTCGTSCATPYPSCYREVDVTLGPGTSQGVNLDPGDWVLRLNAQGECGNHDLNTCTQSTTTFCHIERDPSSGCSIVAYRTVTMAADTYNGAQIY